MQTNGNGPPCQFYYTCVYGFYAGHQSCPESKYCNNNNINNNNNNNNRPCSSSSSSSSKSSSSNDNMRERERKKFYLTTHSTHFIYGYMASDIWLRTILIVRKETRCCHIGYSYRLTARVLLYAPSHRQDNTYHGLCYTSRGALGGTRNMIICLIVVIRGIVVVTVVSSSVNSRISTSTSIIISSSVVVAVVAIAAAVVIVVIDNNNNN